MPSASKNRIILDKAIESEEYIPPRQSANTLFRFFGKADHLYDAIKRGALIPRYYREDIDYLGINCKSIAYPMICFCDINIHRLQEHLDLYGCYGIAFSKAWGVEHGIQPLQYINPNSILRKDFTSAFNASITLQQPEEFNGGFNNTATHFCANYLLSHMFYMKPLYGTMPRGTETIRKNFTDEREWRYIPDLSKTDLPQAIPDDYTETYNKFNDSLEDHDCCWLRFEYEDVKYIILPEHSDLNNFYKQINNISSYNAKRQLVSKVIIWADAKEDF